MYPSAGGNPGFWQRPAGFPGKKTAAQLGGKAQNRSWNSRTAAQGPPFNSEYISRKTFQDLYEIVCLFYESNMLIPAENFDSFVL